MDNSKLSNILQPSQAVQSKMGKRRVIATDRSTRTAINAWASVQLNDLSDGPFRLKTDEWMYESFKKVLESISRYISETWEVDIDVVRDKTFTHPKTGYIHVANKITSEQQAKGVRVKSYNVLSDSDVEKIFEDECTQVSTPTGYVNRLIMVMGMLLGLRATALRSLKWSMFHDEESHDGRPIIRFQGIIGSIDGQSKHAHGGLKASKSIPTSINIFDSEIKFGINPYKMICEHRKLCGYTKNQVDFFLSPNVRAVKREKFLTSGVIGAGHFPRLVERIFSSANIRGMGPHQHPVLHSLRKTMINNLMRAKCTDSQITLRSGHANVQSVRPYANIMAEAGAMQQSNVMGSSSKTGNQNSLKRTSEASNLPADKKRKVEAITRAVIEGAGDTNGGNVTINLNFNL